MSTMPPKAGPSSAQSDPLGRLTAQIERARDSARDGSLRPAEADKDDPIAALERLIDRAHRLDEPLEAYDGPLGELYETIRQARQLPEPAAYERDWDDPIEHLQAQIADEAAQLGAHPAFPGRAGARVPTSPSAPANLEAAVGREVLALLADMPLDGPARARAVEVLVGQLDDPDPEQLRRLLALLVTGREPQQG